MDTPPPSRQQERRKHSRQDSPSTRLLVRTAARTGQPGQHSHGVLDRAGAIVHSRATLHRGVRRHCACPALAIPTVRTEYRTAHPTLDHRGEAANAITYSGAIPISATRPGRRLDIMPAQVPVTAAETPSTPSITGTDHAAIIFSGSPNPPATVRKPPGPEAPSCTARSSSPAADSRRNIQVPMTTALTQIATAPIATANSRRLAFGLSCSKLIRRYA